MNWKTCLERALSDNGDTLVQLVVQARGRPNGPQAVSIDHPIFDREFDGGYGGSEGCYFTAWGELYVYFPAVYDGSEWIETEDEIEWSVA